MWFHVWMGSSEGKRDWFHETDISALALSSAKHVFCSAQFLFGSNSLENPYAAWEKPKLVSSSHYYRAKPFFACQLLHADHHPLLYLALEMHGLARLGFFPY